MSPGPGAALGGSTAILVGMDPLEGKPTGGAGDGDESWVDLVREAAIEAELETGRHEESVDEARRGVAIRIARIVGGFLIMALGIAALPLPGPGWLIIIFGLSLLPFAWAERTIRLIRSKIPGVPEEGRIPLSSWLVMAALLIVFTGATILFGGAIRGFVAELWGDPDELLT